jgi:hypothetical protein
MPLPVWNQATFTQAAQAAGYRHSRFATRTLDPAIAQMIAGAAATAIIPLLLGIPVAKADKYRDALRYFAFAYPGVVAPGMINNGGGFMNGMPDFQTAFYGSPIDPLLDGDLLYGRSDPSEGRDSACYQPLTGANPHNHNRHKPWALDEFNNAAGLGTGIAFGQAWNAISTGAIDTHQLATTANANYNTVGFGPGGGRPAFTQAHYQTYLDGLFTSRFAPDQINQVSKAKLQKHNWRKNAAQMSKPPRVSGKTAALAHNRFFKAIRRICKGGIAMVATSPNFSNARVHFCLDGLGDLGDVAYKEHIGNTLPITSSELCFTCRHWPSLQGKVIFWLNGRMVHPPWTVNWTENDANGNAVHSNQDAWLRYMQYRTLAARISTLPQFP